MHTIMLMNAFAVLVCGHMAEGVSCVLDKMTSELGKDRIFCTLTNVKSGVTEDVVYLYDQKKRLFVLP